MPLFPFDPERVINAMTDDGAVSVCLIPKGLRLQMWDEAIRCPFVESPVENGPYKVIQHLSAATNLPPRGALLGFRDELTLHLADTFGSRMDLFESPLDFNEHVIQRYRPTDVGVSPHRDFSKDRNLICIAMLGGDGQFCLCDDRTGKNMRPLDSTPGNVILMRAPGFRGSDVRPWHCAVNITTERMVFTLRQLAGA